MYQFILTKGMSYTCFFSSLECSALQQLWTQMKAINKAEKTILNTKVEEASTLEDKIVPEVTSHWNVPKDQLSQTHQKTSSVIIAFPNLTALHYQDQKFQSQNVLGNWPVLEILPFKHTDPAIPASLPLPEHQPLEWLND